MTLAISLTALIFSMFVFVQNRRSNRRDLLLKVHDQLLAPERQRGRRALFEMGEKGQRPEDLAPDEFVIVNHALASLDMLGYLFYRRLVPRRDVVAMWGTTAMRACRVAQDTGLLTMRDTQNQMRVWPYLRYLAAWMDARKDHSIRLPTGRPLRVGHDDGETSPTAVG
ncbi:MAG TPA: hypothetical protein VG756_28300 [Pseudonocardiaceae bacterium]|nr:hypothetical protein [Pseudonocardiaceae bacterium]